MKLGIYVGSFNPVHIGHIKVCNYLIDNKYVDKVLILPTPNYWNKTNLVSMKDRINMLRFHETKNIIIDNIHNNYEYTYQVLDSLKKDYPNDLLYLIMGSDNIEKFHLWKNLDDILKNKVIVLQRGNNDIKKYLNKFNSNSFIVIDNFPFIDISSTEIRNNINSLYVGDKVYKYIKKRHLYLDKN